jgi:MinD-like ATPase involved in chromosome partitioning or flagellar assembly
MQRGEIVELLQDKQRVIKFSKAVLRLIKDYSPDFVLIDTHPGLNEEFLVLLEDMDMLFNIVRPDNQDYQGLEVTSSITQKLGVKNYVVLNKVHSKLDKTKLKKQVEKSYSMPVGGVLPFSEEIMLAQSQYVFSEQEIEHEFSQGIQELAAGVLGVRRKQHLEIMQELLMQIRKAKKVQVSKVCAPDIPQKTCEGYVDQMLQSGFIELHKDLVSIAPKGEKFLKKYKTISRFVDKFRV